MSRLAWLAWAVLVAIVVSEILLHILPFWISLPMTLVIGMIAGSAAMHLSREHPRRGKQ